MNLLSVCSCCGIQQHAIRFGGSRWKWKGRDRFQIFFFILFMWDFYILIAGKWSWELFTFKIFMFSIFTVIQHRRVFKARNIQIHHPLSGLQRRPNIYAEFGWSRQKSKDWDRSQQIFLKIVHVWFLHIRRLMFDAYLILSIFECLYCVALQKALH